MMSGGECRRTMRRRGSGTKKPLRRARRSHRTSYSVYDRNALTKTYTYEISVKAFYWLLLLPFSWINFFTYTLEDAVRSTTAQFVIDAQRDGYLGTKN